MMSELIINISLTFRSARSFSRFLKILTSASSAARSVSRASELVEAPTSWNSSIACYFFFEGAKKNKGGRVSKKLASVYCSSVFCQGNELDDTVIDDFVVLHRTRTSIWVRF